MSVNFDRPVMNGRTPEENLAKMETWASNLVQKLNYELNHLDATNFVQEGTFVTPEELQTAVRESEENMRAYIVKKTGGA